MRRLGLVNTAQDRNMWMQLCKTGIVEPDESTGRSYASILIYDKHVEESMTASVW